jgi:FADH2 O2-dependent halogenase
MSADFDIAVLGAGFGGSLAALIQQRAGRRVVLIDRGHHPRFAIGESSTPTADAVLGALTRRYDLPRLAPLARYGTWKKQLPHLMCGIKRGFSYFIQRPGSPFEPGPEHERELLVTASLNDELADTHWFRADIDGYFCEEARREGVEVLLDTEVVPVPEGRGWRLAGKSGTREINLRCRFLIDATGEAQVVPRALGLGSRVHELHTHSYVVFSHFERLARWQSILESRGLSVADHPFPCDHAAVHHMLEEGWMYQLRFDNDIVSAGFVVDGRTHPAVHRIAPTAQFQSIVDRYPSLALQFSGATTVEPPGAIRRSGRIQRFVSQAAGTNWLLLPHTAGAIDPLHSSGIAQTLCAIERFSEFLTESLDESTLEPRLRHYDQTLACEFRLIDQIVHGCYRTRTDGGLFNPYAMLYFAAATTWEHRRNEGTMPLGAAMLCADDPDLVRIIDQAYHAIDRLPPAESVTPADRTEWFHTIRERLAPFNRVGLCDPAAHNMYRYTNAPKH